MARQWTQHILDSNRKSRVLDHCLQAEPVKLQGEFQGLAPARPSNPVQAVPGQTVLSRHRVEIANQSHCFYFCFGCECCPRGFRIRLARLTAVVGCNNFHG